MERAVPVIPVKDLRIAKEFYVQGLGFAITYEDTDDGIEGLLGVERGNFVFHIDSPMPGHGTHMVVNLQVDDVDSYFQEWSKKIEIPDQPKNEVWGARTLTIIDPFGNTLFLIGPIVDE